MEPKEVIAGLDLLASILTPLVIAYIGFLLNKKIDRFKTTSEWKMLWADDFLECAKGYSCVVSKVVVNMSIFTQISKDKQSGWEDELKSKNNEIISNLNNLKLLNWEIKKYIQFSPLRGDYLCRAEEKLFSLLSELIEYAKNPSGGGYDLEKIRLAQFEYNKAVREVHAELMGIN